jgi:hypothetical protein
MGVSNSNGMVFIELSPEMAEFLIENCNSNIIMALNMIDPTGPMKLEEDNVRKVVDMAEKFKAIKKATERALR